MQSPFALTPTLTCDDLPRANVRIFPAHEVEPRFSAFVAAYAVAAGSLSLDDWWKAARDADLYISIENHGVMITSGSYHWWMPENRSLARFMPTDEVGAVLEAHPVFNAGDYTQLSSGVNALISGAANVLLDAPLTERATLRTLADRDARNFQIAEPPGRESLIMLLNLANPERPLPAFHPETGEPLDQGVHPIFGDVRVRRAFQLALDQQALIDGVLQQSADPLAGLYPPSSWAFDPALAPVDAEPHRSEALARRSGLDRRRGRAFLQWLRHGGRGRAADVELGSANDRLDIATQIAAQWERIGASVYQSGDDVYRFTGERFDAYLIAVGGNAYEDADPDRTQMLTPAGDMLAVSSSPYPLLNYNSYNNPDVTRLLQRSRTLLSCDSTTSRRDLSSG